MHTQDGPSLSLDNQLRVPPHIPTLFPFPFLLRFGNDMFRVLFVQSTCNSMEQSESSKCTSTIVSLMKAC